MFRLKGTSESFRDDGPLLMPMVVARPTCSTSPQSRTRLTIPPLAEKEMYFNHQITLSWQLILIPQKFPLHEGRQTGMPRSDKSENILIQQKKHTASHLPVPRYSSNPHLTIAIEAHHIPPGGSHLPGTHKEYHAVSQHRGLSSLSPPPIPLSGTVPVMPSKTGNC